MYTLLSYSTLHCEVEVRRPSLVKFRKPVEPFVPAAPAEPGKPWQAP